MLKNRIAVLGCLALMVLVGQLNAQDDKQEFDLKSAVTEIRQLVTKNKLDEALDAFGAAIEQVDENSIEAMPLQTLRRSFAMNYSRKRNYEDALDQCMESGKYFVLHLDNAQARAMLTMNATMMTSLAARAGKTKEVASLVDRALTGLREQEGEGEVTLISRQLAGLLAIRAREPNMSNGNRERLGIIINDELRRLQDFYELNASDEMGITAFSSILATASTFHRDDVAKRSELAELREDLLTKSLETNLESRMIAADYASAMQSKIALSFRNDPEEAKKTIDETLELLEKANEKQDSRLAASIKNIKRYEGRIASALKVKEMIGKPAPDLDFEAWVNNDAEVSLESLQGKVVMLDFWAVWCGPCVATFPHLREWREEFHEQGFEIVGVTRYYNYEWDEENEKAKRVDKKETEVPAEDEQVAVSRFMKSHELEHPSIFTPTGSKMQSEFGVTGIPHAVLIDRQGNIRMVKVGSGKANAEALHEMIKELLEEEQ